MLANRPRGLPFTSSLLAVCALAAAGILCGVTLRDSAAGPVVQEEPSSPAAPVPRPSTDIAIAPCDRSAFKIALDVGHTVQSSGALSARGVAEYTFNLTLAKRIERTLTGAGFDHTYLMISNGTGRAQLAQRSGRVNALGVDLLLSIHHDDVQPHYYESWTYKGTVYHFSDKFSGYSIFVSSRNPSAADSLDFAKLLGTELVARGLHFSAHHSEPIPGENRQLLDAHLGIYRYDDLFVLRNIRAPSVLLEAGIIVNREEELLLASSERQDLVGAAVLAASNKFCSEIQLRRTPKKG
jgi:N-acetylmuramoyl-L-alanine amidase